MEKFESALIRNTVAEDSDPDFFVTVVPVMDFVSAADSDQRQKNQGLHGYLVHKSEHMWANTEFTAYILKDG